MCGVFGFYSETVKLTEEDLEKVKKSLYHRGPDFCGCYQKNNFYFIHSRLSIIDLSEKANQPLFSNNKKYLIIYNGEVYNYRELKSDYKINTISSSDTEVIVELYAHKNNATWSLLNGMFAGAIFDLENEIITIFRDRYGIKPLFYFQDKNVFAFSSEIKTLLCCKYINQKIVINEEALPYYFHLGFIPEPYTIFKNLYKFPAGCFGIFDGKQFKIHKYYNCNVHGFTDKCFSNEAEVIEILKQRIEKSVKSQLNSDVPYGVFLSGGIDSSLITAIASKHVSNLNTFTIGFNEPKYDESKYANKIATYLGTIHNEYILTYNEALNYIEDIITTYDEPFADSSAIPAMIISKLASQQVKMILCGEGGDELFLGYGSYKWAKILDSFFAKKLRFPVAFVLNFLGNKYKRASFHFIYNNNNFVSPQILSQELYFFSLKELNNLIKFYFELNFEIEKTNNLQQEQILFNLKYYLRDDLLVKTDRATMKYSIEARVPFLDNELVNFVLSIDNSLKLKNGNLKYLTKKLLSFYLPQNFFNRPKWGFALPIEYWLKNQFKNKTIEILSSYKEFPLVDFSVVSNLLKQFYDKEYIFLYNRIWNLLIFKMWYDNFMKQYQDL